MRKRRNVNVKNESNKKKVKTNETLNPNIIIADVGLQ